MKNLNIMKNKNIIKIVYYEDRNFIDSFGRREASFQGPIIISVLNYLLTIIDNSEETEGFVFNDEQDNEYLINDLIGKEIQLDEIGIFKVN